MSTYKNIPPAVSDVTVSASGSQTRAITFTLNEGGAVLTTGVKCDVTIPFACTITGWTLVANESGSIVLDIWNDTYANYPATVADTIAGSEKPTLSSATKNQDLSLSTWSTSIAAGSIMRCNVDSVTSITRAVLTLNILVPLSIDVTVA